MSLFQKKQPKPKPDLTTAIMQLKKDCTYIIAVPAGKKDDFLAVLDKIDLSNGPQILLVDDMDLTVMAFSKSETKPPTVIFVPWGDDKSH